MARFINFRFNLQVVKINIVVEYYTREQNRAVQQNHVKHFLLIIYKCYFISNIIHNNTFFVYMSVVTSIFKSSQYLQRLILDIQIKMTYFGNKNFFSVALLLYRVDYLLCCFVRDSPFCNHLFQISNVETCSPVQHTDHQWYLIGNNIHMIQFESGKLLFLN